MAESALLGARDFPRWWYEAAAPDGRGSTMKWKLHRLVVMTTMVNIKSVIVMIELC